MQFEWDTLITLGILVLIGFWVAAKIKKQTLRETFEDFVVLIKGEK